MLYLKKIKKYYFNYFIWFVSLILVLTILSYFNIINKNIINIAKITIPIIIIFIYSVKSAKKTTMKGYLNGLLFGSLIVITMFILNLIFYRIFHFKQFIYYIILLLTSTLGSMFSKTKKSQLNN